MPSFWPLRIVSEAWQGGDSQAWHTLQINKLTGKAGRQELRYGTAQAIQKGAAQSSTSNITAEFVLCFQFDLLVRMLSYCGQTVFKNHLF